MSCTHKKYRTLQDIYRILQDIQDITGQYRTYRTIQDFTGFGIPEEGKVQEVEKMKEVENCYEFEKNTTLVY